MDIDQLARSKAGMGPDWSPYLYRCLPEGGEETQVVEITGAVGRMITKGPRKGQTTWKGADPSTKRTVYLTPAELRAAQEFAAARKEAGL